MYRLFRHLPSNLNLRRFSITTNKSTFHTDRELLALQQIRDDKVALDNSENTYKQTGSLYNRSEWEKAHKKHQNSFDTAIAIWKLENNTPRPK